MGIEKIEAFICKCDNCGEVYDNGDFIPSTGDEVEMESIIGNDSDWIKDNGKYYCPECYELDDDGYPTINKNKTLKS